MWETRWNHVSIEIERPSKNASDCIFTRVFFINLIMYRHCEETWRRGNPGMVCFVTSFLAKTEKILWKKKYTK